MRASVLVLLLVLSLAATAYPAPASAPMPGPKDKCPVCGMFVAKYPDWVATATFRDGSIRFFDGAKDCFRYLLQPAGSGARQRLEVAEAIYVKDYYRLEQIDGRKAFFVIGGDVLGPMGKELIPFANRQDAEDFLRDHRGTQIVSFDQVTTALLTTLD